MRAGLRELVDSSPNAVAVFDRDLRYARVNTKLAEFFACTPADLEGQRIDVLGAAEQTAPFAADLAIVLATGQPITQKRFATEALSLDGALRAWRYSVHPILEDGCVIGVICHCEELTAMLAEAEEESQLALERERRDAERREELRAVVEELARKRVQLEEAQSLAQVGSWEADITTRTTTWSREMLRMFGVPATTVPTEELFISLIHPEDRSRIVAIATGVLESGKPADYEMRVVRPCGDVRIMASRTRAILDADGTVIRLIGTNQDITERRALEARAVVQDRMSALGCLAAGLAHEINNPLSYVLGNGELALEKIAKLQRAVAALPCIATEQRTELVEHITSLSQLVEESRDGGARVRAIVRDMRMFSRGDETNHRAPVDVDKIAESAANIAATEIRHRARLVRDLGCTSPALATDSRLGEVVLNLLVNAGQAIPDGQSADAHEVRLTTRTRSDGCTVIEVKDTGCGIPPENLRRIFDPFFTTKPVGSGTGLGLSICHSIIESFGGTLSAESQVGKGSTFRVTLPATVGRPRPRTTDPVPTVSKRARVLIVDDEPMVVAFMRRCLAKEHDVIGVTCAAEALSRIRAGDEFELIVCDLMMPEISGFELYKRVSTEMPALAERFLFMTGGTFTADAQAFVDSLAAPYLEKPFAPAQLRTLVRERVLVAS